MGKLRKGQPVQGKFKEKGNLVGLKATKVKKEKMETVQSLKSKIGSFMSFHPQRYTENQEKTLSYLGKETTNQ